jgi:MFS family permease
MITAINSTGYGEGIASMKRDLNCSNLAATAGITSSLVVWAFAPLILAPISEQFGRRGMMLISSIVFTLCFIPQALASNIVMVIVFRGLQGAAASSANSLVGGVVADVFQAEIRGAPMNMLSFLILSGQGLGAVIFGKYCYGCIELDTYGDKQDGWR